ncbi:hypothetical protein TruAng_010021 [Truncatella angustata]|nr:hypothetical protein TruAng_010021 [Truncatella angustata]
MASRKGMQHPLPGLQHSGSVYTTSNGAPVKNPSAFQRVGQNGPLLLQDFHLIDLLAHFDRERIPERVVHAKGAGAYGEFVVTHDVSDLTSASMLNAVGKKTRALVRFSTVGGEKGSPDSARDPRGFAIKFYTEEGNWDWVFNNTPVFFLRDPANFPTFIHTQKRNPQSNLKDADAFWDYLSTHQECTHQGNKTFTGTEASKMEAENPDWQTQDLFKAIQKGDFPSWDVYVQVLTPEQAEGFKWNIFDLTKVWPQKDVPLRPFGRLTLNQNADNYFAEIEQAAFSPSHLVPGVEPSADPVLQSRLFSYPDTHRHRLGVNYQQIPVNQPLRAFNPFQRDGAMAVNGNHGALPNYPSSSRPLIYSSVSEQSRAHERWTGQVVSDVFSEVKPKDFEQANGLWRVLAKTTGQQANFVQNVAGHLCNAQKSIRERTYGMFSRVNSDLGRLIRVETEKRTKTDESPIRANL